jgi:type II secretory pathway component PulJ
MIIKFNKPTRHNNAPSARDNATLGFTLLEVTVSVSLLAISILLVGSLYSLAQRSYGKGSEKAELSQNSRVATERLSRELRQAAGIVTALPETESEPPAEEIFFQDGHDNSQITYLRYYLDGTNLIRQHKAYYFASEPDTYVVWNSRDQNGNPPSETEISGQIVGEYFNSLEFWGMEGLINISANLNKGQSNVEITTSIYKRN